LAEVGLAGRAWLSNGPTDKWRTLPMAFTWYLDSIGRPEIVVQVVAHAIGLRVELARTG
jgi:hypothetical protein